MPTKRQLSQMRESELEYPQTRREDDPAYFKPKESTMTSNKTDFQILDEMATADEDISMSPNLVSADLQNNNGYVKMGVDAATIHKIMSGDYMVALYVINKRQYRERKSKR